MTRRHVLRCSCTGAASLALAASVMALATGCGNEEAGPASAPRTAGDASGGERSLQTFGREASDAERAAIEAAFRGYLEAVANRDYATACSRLGAGVKASLARFVAGAGGGACARSLPKLLTPSAAAVARGQASGEIGRVRVDGAQAFVLFRAPGAHLYLMTMEREGDAWNVANLAASVAVPDL